MATRGARRRSWRPRSRVDGGRREDGADEEDGGGRREGQTGTHPGQITRRSMKAAPRTGNKVLGKGDKLLREELDDRKEPNYMPSLRARQASRARTADA